jgi:hypothetical protein
MEPKTTSEVQIPPALPAGEGLAPEVEVWDPPFERWIRLADVLLRRGAPPLPKAKTPPDSKSLIEH